MCLCMLMFSLLFLGVHVGTGRISREQEQAATELAKTKPHTLSAAIIDQFDQVPHK